ncbi:MAG: HlyD family type I secretion periplasmic adaptor subunit [Pseudomonadota bacterium]
MGWFGIAPKGRVSSADFSPRLLNVIEQPPSPLPRLMLRLIGLLLIGLLVWAAIGELDIVARAEGKLIPQTRLKVVQPFEGGLIEKILVHEGQRVQAGQSLMIMDAHLSAADTKKLKTELASVRLQMRRIEAELGATAFELQPGDVPEQFDIAFAQYQSHKQAYQTTLYEQEAVLEQTRRELDAEQMVRKKLEAILPILQETEVTYQKLGQQGHAAKLLVLEKQQARIEVENDLKAQGYVIQSLTAKLREMQEKIRSIKSAYHQRLYDEKVSLSKNLAQWQQDYAKQQYRNTLMELKAPQDGVVMDLVTHTEGTVIPSGSVVMRLVPLNEPLKAEVYVTNKDVGFVIPGQTARIKLTSYQFQKYGMVDAQVERVSADAAEKSETSGALQSSQPASLTYRTLMRLDRQQLERNGQTFGLRAGMHVTAEIKLGKRSVLEYLLSPIQKTLAEAGTER